MSTSRLFITGVLALSLAGLLSSSGLATERYASTSGLFLSEANAPAPPASDLTGTVNADLVRASNVLHTRVKDPQGTTLGRVHDIVLAPDLKSVSYVAVSRGGILGLGTSLYAVPWSALSPSVNGTYVLPVTEQQFQQSRGFSQDNWPSAPSVGWTAQSQESLYGEPAAQAGNISARRFTRLRGTEVKGSQGAHVGDVKDLVIATNTGQIAYTILSYGGILGLGQKYAAVPENAITLEPALGIARVDAPKAVVRANSFTPNRWPALSNASYAQQLAAAYGVAPSTALAYVPPEGIAVAAAPKTPARPRTRAPSAPGVTTPATVAPPTPAELTGTFNPSKTTTINGTVIDQGKFQLTPSGQQMLWMRVRTSNGQTVLVDLGPRNYISTQDFYVVPGDEIRLSGSEVSATTPGKQVFLPTQAMYNGHTLKLRSENGTPLWEGPMTAPTGQQPGAAGPSQRGTLGFVPPGPQANEGTAGTSAAGQAPTQFTPSTPVAVGALDLANLQTIEGTVTEVGKSQPTTGGPETIWLRVRTTNGRTMNVQVGPRNYVSRQDFFVVNGDRVRMTGWNARISGAPGAPPVFIPADISHDGQTLQLRNRDGEPLWTSQAAQSGQRPGRMGRAPGRQMPGTMTPSEPPPGTATPPGTAGTQRTTPRPTGEPNEPNKP